MEETLPASWTEDGTVKKDIAIGTKKKMFMVLNKRKIIK
jgi:hypothetical protein